MVRGSLAWMLDVSSVDDFLKEKGFIFPLDLGGLRLLRYGSLHDSVLGLQVVLPDKEGTILSSGMQTGNDLKQLFIGSDGTLGVITGATVLTPPRLAAVNVALISVNDYATIQKVFVLACQKLGEIFSAFEFFYQQASDLVLKRTQRKDPFTSSEGPSPFYVLIKTSGSNKKHNDVVGSVFLFSIPAVLDALIKTLMDSEMMSYEILSQDEAQLQSIWSFRELISESFSKKLGNDSFNKAYCPMMELKGDCCRVFWGLDTLAMIEVLEPWIYEKIASHNGSISTEHGLGLMKSPYLSFPQPPTNIRLMKSLKNLFDSQGMLNPSKFLPWNPRLPVPFIFLLSAKPIVGHFVTCLEVS
ncbi:uncharacterized protein VP01_540g10 [Puccinia sorghi]|uniref:FAD-binding oxidoreductase/transferase type 4 C-terminal domain-containing protein n=1 Tax=Puccinia sorghi TaxID=27349 RepID=A0A0L6UKJ6_9BASI|nr:uncharacterized protein VP01_540g10 [Puccinia sorghi]